MKNKSFYEKNLNEGDNPQIEEFINQLFLSLEHGGNYEFDEELIEKCYYNSYLLIFNSLKLLNSKDKTEINPYLVKAAETLETLSRLNHPKLNKEELIFDSMITYYISNNYPRAYVLSKDNANLELPKYKESIFIFMNKDFHELRTLILKEINSDKYDEDLLIEKLESTEINNFDALDTMLSYSIFKALNNVLNFLLLGDETFIEDSLDLMDKYKQISLVHNFVDYWWVISCLEIIIKELYENSLWNQLKPFYSDSDEELNNKLTNYIFNHANRETPIVELWPSQISAIPKILKNNENLTIKMPTSAGKTFVAELLILKYYMEGNFYNNGKVIYVSPFKSLSNEIETSLRFSLNSLNLKISDFYGGFDSNDYENYFLDELDILIVTPEKFDVLLRNNNYLKDEIGLIIVDEGHIMGTYDNQLDKYSVRSTKFEFFMYRLKNLFKDSRIVFISGVLSNINDFSKWLSNDENNLIDENWKPTNIYVGALYWTKNDKGYIDYIYKNYKKLPEVIDLEFMDYIHKDCFINSKRKKIPTKDNEALALSSIELAKEGQTYVYAPTKRQINALSKSIIEIMNVIDLKCYNYTLNINLEDKDIAHLIKIIKNELGDESELLTYLNYGFIIHHADLPDNVKIAIEQALKNKKIKLVIATSTIVQGVNFPFKNIIFKGLYIKNPIDYSTFFNICGRVGRANENNNGRVLLSLGIVNKKNYQKKKRQYDLFCEYFDNDTYQLKSVIEPLLTKLKAHHDSINCTIEEYCVKVINTIDIEEIFDYEEILNINTLDAQLLAFIEEEEDELKILENFINVSLHHVQFRKIKDQKYLKGFINSRLSYLKKEFSENTIRSRAYNMGLSLKDCKYIEKNYDELKNLFLKSKNWKTSNKDTKEELLLNIALKMLELDTLKYEYKISEKDEILISWIKDKNFERNCADNLSRTEVNKFINFCSNMLPWAITSILNFFRLKEPRLQIPKVCEYFSEMFKYGIFDLKIIILMPWANNNYKFCKKLSEHIEIEELNFNKIYVELEQLYLELENKWTEKELEEFEKYLHPFRQKELSKVHITLNENIGKLLGKFIYILNNKNNISLYDLEGNHIINIDFNNIKIINDKKINIENIWEVKSLQNNNLLLISLENRFYK
ncbi:DEAD/DEAH box helicase [uncultured Methanobrevibacter sp.]|uniref:DEAD/DEAH box helicase n=1 Tax=uncultured Methanobrevibacter sp. TaxID=253161 RepID=UPI002603A79A|nr:DEAD/DEAH box helicase [uncultured Methanobrevibacter sp.]